MTTLQSIQELHNKVFKQDIKQINYSEAINMITKIKQSKSFEEKYQLLLELFIGFDNIVSINVDLREFTDILNLMKAINRPKSEINLDELFEKAINS